MISISQLDNIKNSANPEEIAAVRFCQVCDWYGYPHEKIIVEFEGFRPEEQDGFAYKFSEYDYDVETGEKRTIHKHKYDPRLVQKFVDLALQTRNGGGNC
jgi:hypothetical protein